MARVFSYVVAHDGGFSPNPFHGWCTLACCKPAIRRSAAPGDLIIGMSRRCVTAVYLMRVEEKLTFEQYWRDPRFRKKRPDWDAETLIRRCGDNIYEPDDGTDFRQLRSSHWDHESGREDDEARRRDTSGPVLVGEDFVYFGGSGPPIPDSLDFLEVGRGHRCRITAPQVELAFEFFSSLPRGVRGRPRVWSESDTSWKASCASS